MKKSRERLLKLLEEIAELESVKKCNRFILNINKAYINKNDEIDYLHIMFKKFSDLDSLLSSAKNVVEFNFNNSILEKKDLSFNFIDLGDHSFDLVIKLLDIEYTYSVYEYKY